jgi:hypothetical protein
MRRALLHLSRWIFVSTLTVGCTFANQYTALREPPHPLVSRPPSEIEIFSSSAPRRAHVDLGLIYVRVIGGWDAQIRALRDAGSAHGCDALALSGGWGATCIVYMDVPPVGASAVPALIPTPAAKPEAVIEVEPGRPRP